MKKQLNKLSEFQQKFRSIYNTEPTLIPFDDYHLRYKLLEEENEEYMEACEQNDLVEVADALGDQLYIVLGSIVSHGMQHIIEDVFNEIHVSNLSFASFVLKMEHVSKKYGTKVQKVDRWFASSKTCFDCGKKNDKLKLSDREWVCQSCGTVHDRDKNASKNILRQGIVEYRSGSKTANCSIPC